MGQAWCSSPTTPLGEEHMCINSIYTEPVKNVDTPSHSIECEGKQVLKVEGKGEYVGRHQAMELHVSADYILTHTLARWSGCPYSIQLIDRHIFHSFHQSSKKQFMHRISRLLVFLEGLLGECCMQRSTIVLLRFYYFFHSFFLSYSNFGTLLLPQFFAQSLHSIF